MTVTDSSPGQHVRIALEFIEPFASKADTEFQLVPAGDVTQVVWSMSGGLGFMEKAMGLFMSMDAMIGKDFDKGLAQLRTVSEAEAARAAAAAAEQAAAERAAAEQAAAAAAAAEAARAKPARKKR
jgi:hypothetical protein